MNIKLLDFSDLKPNLSLPGPCGLHVWILPADPMDNLHKYAHTCLEQILAAYTGIPQENLEFSTGKYGKPFLLNAGQMSRNDTFSSFSQFDGIQFNLSHSGRYAAFVFSSQTPVGIDIERLDRKADIDRIAARLFLPDEICLLKSLSGEQKRLAFFRLWTRTESFLKGIGTGFGASFTDIKIQEEYSSWKHQYICAPDGYVCSVSYRNL